jgi:hypothetical protein
MKRFWQIVGNLVLYAGLIYLAIESTFIEADYYFAFVVWFLLFVALVITVIPGVRAKSVSPGEYPYGD